MFGLKFRSWMESHIVRPRKKQQQQQQQQQQQLQQQQQAGAAAAAAGRGAKAFGGGKAAGAAPGGGRGGRPLAGSPSSPARARRDRDREAAAQAAAAAAAASSAGGGGISLLAHAHQRGTAHSLSSPESAYSTGYSTDGTSPGASFPPEYYINLRTGTHYFHSSGGGAGGGGPGGGGPGAAAASGAALAHQPPLAYHHHHNHHQPCPPQHPRVVQVSEGAGLVGSHRRTESYDECRRAPLPVAVPVPPTPGSRASYALPDDYSSPPPGSSAAPSPRQRNRIRTNPWLAPASSSLSSTASSSSAGRGSLAGASGSSQQQPPQQQLHQRPLESSSGSDATLPRRANDAAAAAAAVAGRAWARQGATPTPPLGSRGSASASASPAPTPAAGTTTGLSGSAVTSPRRASLCSSTSSSTVSSASSCGVNGAGHTVGGSSAASSGCGGRACVSAPVVGRATLSAHLSLSADEHDELDLDDEDDLTLNEMLGKFDESYVYEKETDILSDSDPTDCDEDTDFDTGQECGDDDGDVDGDDEDEGEAGSGEADAGSGDLADEEEFDFIDNGSCVDVEAAAVEERRRPPRNRGHCTYHMPADLLPQSPSPQPQQQAVAQPARKPSARYRESFLRRSSARRHSAARSLHAASEHSHSAAAATTTTAADAATAAREATGSPLPVARQHSSRRSAEDGFPVGRRSSSRHHHHHHMQQAHGQPGSRNSSEKKRPSRCSVRRSANSSIRERQHESDHDRDREREWPTAGSRTAATGSPLPKHNGLHNQQQQVHPQQYTDKSTDVQLGPSVMNLNKVLMQKMLERTGVIGTRSAGNTPISLRRRILEGEGVPLSPSRLINKNIRPLHPMNCNTGANGNWNQDVSPKMITDVYCSPQKQRSNSVSSTARRSDTGFYGGGNGLMRNGARGNANYLATFSSEMALVEADKEADRKYRELILEAENILVSMKGGVMDKTTNLMLPRPKPYFLNSNYLNDNCPRTRPPAKLSANEATTALNSGPRNEVRSPPEILRSRTTSPKRIAENHNEDQDLQNGNTFSITEEDSFKRYKESDKILASPRKRQNRNIRSMPMQGSSSSESDGSSTPHQEDVTFSPKIPVSASTNNFQRPALTTFRSIDIGNAADGSRYCPQSEPVKRKVYTCSATFDRLQKSLEKSQHTSFRQKSDSAKNATNEGEKSGRESLKEKLEQLRKERLEVEAKVREAQEDERRKFDDKMQFSLLRRQMLVHTIEGLKKSLEDQSAKLQETYQPDIEVPVSNRRHSSSSIGLQQEPDCIENEQ